MEKSIVIDIGNTRLKAGVFFNNILLSQQKIKLTDEHKIFDLIIKSGVKSIIVSNVSGKEVVILNQLPADVAVYNLGSETILPFKNTYKSKQTLGADRLALIAGAQHFFENCNCLVIDAGTCITYDILTADGKYPGGNISPGLQMRLKAMHNYTGKLPLPEWKQPEELMGTDTKSCLLTGAWFGLLGEIQFIIDQYSKDFDDLKVLLSGGDATILAKHIKNSIFVNEHLLLYGLNKILIVNVN
ncbi:MAG: type III pantothenate kinase [Bacteroidia bacterium]|nr:type III pantothenate kinase [Bacteroidia bacterium]